MRFLTLLSFFFFGTAMADSFPFGSGTLPYLLKGSDSVAIMKQFAETPDGNWWLSLDEVLYGEPMDSVNVMKIARTVSAPAQLAPESGNLIFLKRFTPEEIRKRGDKAEWYVVSSYLGIYRSEERIQATRSYLSAHTDEEKLNWAMDLLRNTRDADLFFSATLALQNVNPSIVSENLVGELLNKFPPRTLGAYGVWNLLLKTGSKQVFEAFRSWLENPKRPNATNSSASFTKFPNPNPCLNSGF